jgi:hypothetical protein
MQPVYMMASTPAVFIYVRACVCVCVRVCVCVLVVGVSVSFATYIFVCACALVHTSSGRLLIKSMARYLYVAICYHQGTRQLLKVVYACDIKCT